MLKSWLKKILIISLELLLISGALWYVAEKKGIKSADQIMPALQQAANQVAQKVEEKVPEKPFPAETESVKKTFDWQYKGVKYSLSETLYKSAYQYYQSQPKTYTYLGNLPENWEDQFYGMFLKIPQGDQEIATLANELQTLGKKHGLTDDQIVELTLSFVQSIPYDDAKAKSILAKSDNVSMRYPYEVLFEQAGVCSDKSLLTAALLRQMGYGAALFAYEDDNHMAVAVECPKNSSTYDSGYCYAETTAVGNKIGIIPTFDQASNKTVSLSDFNNNQQQNLKQLGQVTIFQKTSGKLYNGVAATEKTITEISELKNQLDASFVQVESLQKVASNEENDLKNLQDQLDASKKVQDVQKYNSLIEEYNNKLEDYKKDAKKYNSSVTLYNQMIARYNLLIKQ